MLPDRVIAAARELLGIRPGRTCLLVRRTARRVGLSAFTGTLIRLRHNHPVFRRNRFLAGVEAADLGWYTPSGTPMMASDGQNPVARRVTLYLDGADDVAVPDAGRAGSGSRSSTRTNRPAPAARAYSAPATTSPSGPARSFWCVAGRDGPGATR
jgi:pullulanase/glycogen debranching enzyme